MKYSNVLFDLGGVLIDVDVRRSLLSFAKMVQVPQTGNIPNSLSEMVNADGLLGGHSSELIDQYQVGAITTDYFVDSLLSQCRPDTTRQQIIDAWHAMLIGIKPEKKEVLKQLIAAGKNIYVLSNINELHVDWTLAHCPELQVAKCLFFSNEIHLSKPDPRCYELVLKETGIDPQDTVYIDDLLPNIEAGRQFGFQCIQAMPDNNWIKQILS